VPLLVEVLTGFAYTILAGPPAAGVRPVARRPLPPVRGLAAPGLRDGPAGRQRRARLLAAPPAEEDTELLNSRRRARIASPGRLRELIEQGCDHTFRLPAANSSRRCSVCGGDSARDWDPSTEIDYRCAAGHRLDQDRNAAQNRLQAAADRLAAR
jgi:hypothetical protein